MTKVRVWIVVAAGILLLGGLTAWTFDRRTRTRTPDREASDPVALRPADAPSPINTETRRELWSLLDAIKVEEPPELTREALLTLLDTWNADGSYVARVAKLRDENESYFLKLGETVIDDDDVDELVGGADLDWFLFDPLLDLTPGRKDEELVN